MRRCSAVIQSWVRSFWLLLVALLLAICVGTAAGADAAEDTPELLGVTPVGETDVVVAPGEPFTLAVNATVSGDLPLSYQWYRTEDSYSWGSPSKARPAPAGRNLGPSGGSTAAMSIPSFLSPSM